MTPINLYSLDMPYDAIKAEYGGKAAGLHRLYKHFPFVTTNNVWVLPCEACFDRPIISLPDSMNVYTLYSVRSGAPVSMPGLLDTKLNVKYEDIPAAVYAVWDSWDSEHAKQYREMKGIPHDMGTGVIIMPMVDALYAGVAFTAALDGSNMGFNPTIEYVNGLGDKLVDGRESEPFTENVHYKHSLLMRCLQQLHDEYGASDVEWAIDKNNTLYLLQWRKQKFTETENNQTIQAETIVGDRIILAKGEPLGAKVTIKTEGKKVLYLDSFSPAYYSKMLTTDAIITGTGGTTCHAAIVSRERNIPAIRAVLGYNAQAKIRNAPTVYFDGATGEVFTLADGATETIEVSTVESTVATADPQIPQCQQFYHNRYNINAMLYQFYKAFDAERETKLAIHKDIAGILSSYLFAICIGEGRHYVEYGNVCRARDWSKIFGSLNVYFKDSCLERNKQIQTIPEMSNLQHAVDIISALCDLFETAGWSSSYGGKKWYEIADLCRDYLTGTLSDTLFVDSCWNKKHNGNFCFDKFENVSMECTLGDMLNYKQQYSLEQFMSHYNEYDKAYKTPVPVSKWIPEPEPTNRFDIDRPRDWSESERENN